ncbi:proteasome-domain-containing protein [Hyphopichia burtonii NRRL Y-1933]|uniref:Proteasome subunit beta n=1 Tax=Hyphopichia burtonii NRRL Y-1933 TaxID=984485 RepID=A0A1E4RJU4_9ASCO|nr:proteasome-domain-containing protein [Hyphopichia burtonii NRRL Y-1933]ODV67547.1 proteasome-domain-containing protein [Hyphopichia burtonii NRRL Y-1933]
MDIVLGIRVQDSTIIATSKAATRGISVLKTTDDKTRALNTHNLLAYTGEAGDTVQFAEYIQANIQLYTMRENDIELSPKATASFVRNELATSIRSRKPFQVNVLLGGFDPKTNTPSLNWIDYLGTQVELPYAAHGYAAFYCTSLLDRHYRPDMKLEEGLELLKLSLKELETRMPIDFKGVYVKVVDKDGIRDVAEY